LYASGFPKAQDIGKAIQRRQGVEKTKEIPKEKQTKTAGFANNGAQEKDAWSGVETVCTSPEAQQWAGWKTSLKPAHEPICMARKPFKGSTIDNVLANGLGALNIDATRVESYEPIQRKTNTDFTYATESKDTTGITYDEQWHNEGRFPSNVIGEVAGYQKYFYCPKVSRKERHTGFDTANIPQMGSTHPDDVKKHPLWDPSIGGDAARLKRKIDEAGKYKGNNHPTVKPVELMKYLIKLVTPPNSTVLDPFCGSGSTGMAAVELGHQFIGCELDENYVRIAETRITAWNTAEPSGTTFEQLFE
jgi:hypothetical protein